MSIPKQRIESLDGLRGLAILLVLFFHLFHYLPGSDYGWSGVDLFFVLSGFLITGILIDSKDRQGYWKNFYMRRILRIFPLYYLSIILILFTVWFLQSKYQVSDLHFSFLWQNQEWLWLYAINWWEFLMERSFHAHYVSHFWTLAVEEQFYLIWPFVVFYFRGNYLIIVILVFLLSALLIRYILFYYGNDSSYPEVYVATFTRMDSIAVGAIISIAIKEDKLLTILRKYKDLLFFLSLALILYTGFTESFRSGAEGFIKFGYTTNAILFGSILISAINPDDWIARLLDNSFLKFFGKHSYAIYLFHWPLYYFIYKNFNYSNIYCNLIISFLALIGSLILSLISWYAFEKKLNNLKKYFKN